jgi:hypothetical protein
MEISWQMTSDDLDTSSIVLWEKLLNQLYKFHRIIVFMSIMKKSEKIKGKEAVAIRKKSRSGMRLLLHLRSFWLLSSVL